MRKIFVFVLLCLFVNVAVGGLDKLKGGIKGAKGIVPSALPDGFAESLPPLPRGGRNREGRRHHRGRQLGSLSIEED